MMAESAISKKISGSVGMYDEIVNLKFLMRMEFMGGRTTIDWCMKVGLLSNRYECPVCEKPMMLREVKTGDGYSWVCRSSVKGSTHDITRTVRKGSMFSSVRFTLDQLLQATEMWLGKCPVEYVCNTIEVSSKVAVDWRDYCREICFEVLVSESEKIGGEDCIVEIDEGILGKRKMSNCMFSGFERESGRCFLKVVSDFSSECLLEVIEENVLPGTTLVSSCWKKYKCRTDDDFRRLKKKHKLVFEDEEDTVVDKWCLIQWDLEKHKRSKNNYHTHLAEHLWRKQQKAKGMKNLFNAFLAEAIKVYPPDYKDVGDMEVE